MELIRIKDHVSHASTYEEGDVIFTLLQGAFQRSTPVELSFDGINAVPSAFINAALVRLVEDHDMSEVKRLLRISNSNRGINEMIKQRFDFVEAQKKQATAV